MDRQAGILDWYFEIPPITRTYLTSIAAVAILCQLEYIGPLQLYFNYRLVVYKHQFWRLVTPFLYFGPINFDFLFHMFFLMRYCRVLEEESFRNRPADFLFMLLFGASLMLIVGPVLKATFLSTALTFMIVYVWARRNPQVMMNFLGAFNFTAPFMPWVLLGFSFLLSGQLPVADLIGIGAGHAYYYLADVYPLLYGSQPLKTPAILSTLLNPREPLPIQVPIMNEAGMEEVEGYHALVAENNRDDLYAAVSDRHQDIMGDQENLANLADDEASTSKPLTIRRRHFSRGDEAESEKERENKNRDTEGEVQLEAEKDMIDVSTEHSSNLKRE